MAKIDRVQDLPAWFNLENYRATERFGAIEWYEQLAQRQYLVTVLEYRAERREDLRQTASEAFSRSVNCIRGVPVESAHIPNFFGGDGLSPNLMEAQGVHFLTFRHLKEHAGNINWPASLSNPEKWLSDMCTACDSEEDIPELTDSPLFLTTYFEFERERYATARVDLDLPDSVILESFKEWLKEARTVKGERQDGRYHRPKFHRWPSYGVLPYIDLLIWAMETDTHIPDRVMSAAISRYDAGDSNLRKTVIPLAERLLRGDLSDIKALAAMEAAARAKTLPETFED